MAEKEKIKSVAIAQSPENLTNLLWWDLWRAVHKQIPENLNELKQYGKE